MTDSQGTADTPAKKKRSRIVTVIAWCVAGLLVPACGAWVIGRGSYWFDVIASQQMLISWAGLAVTIAMLLTRRKAPAAVCAVLVAVSFYPVLAGRVWSLPEVDLTSKPEGVIRVITYNIHPKNEQWKQDMDRLLSCDADVIVLIEVNRDMSRSVMRWGYLDSTPYRYWLHRAWVERETSPCFILSRWPIEQQIASQDPKTAQHQLYAQVQSPLGAFVVGLVHPLSPRTVSRWIIGNAVIESQAVAIDQLRDQPGHPMLVCADLNAGPAQLRAGHLRNAGLEMSKPVLRLGGSFPASPDVPKALRVQLDDVWTSGSIRPSSWSMIRFEESDHQAVIADFVFTGSAMAEPAEGAD